MHFTRRTMLAGLGGATAFVSPAVADRGSSPVQSGSIRASRTRTVVGAPVTVQGPDGVQWALERTPRGSEAEPHDPTSATTSVRPDVTGRYVVAAALEDGRERVSFRADDRSDLVERYAPKLHFHAETEYRPTRIEAMLEHAELRRTDEPAQHPPVPGGEYPRKRLQDDPHDGETVAADPTVFDLVDRDGSHYLYLPDERSNYRTYHEAYPPTLYASVTDTTFRGKSYTAIVYWHFLAFDPKHGLAQFFEHQADLESVVVLVGEDGPEWFAAAQHGYGEFRRWEATPRDGTHAHIYLEKGAHASMLRNSDRYDGDGFLVQGYYLGNDSPFSDDTETDPVFTVAHTDETGSSEVWSPDETEDVTYDIVPLVGNELWSTYEGGFSADPAGITGPHQRHQYADPGGWIVDRPFPDHDHVDATVDVYTSSVEGDALTVHVGVKNWGPKPHPYWASVETKPPGADWDDARLLADERFRVGTDREAFARVEAGGRRVGHTRETRRGLTMALPDDYERDWDVRVQVWSYRADVRTAEDFHDERTVSPDGVSAAAAAIGGEI